MKKLLKKFVITLTFFTMLNIAQNSYCEAETSQSIFFVKILNYVKNISSLEIVNVGIVFDNNSESIASRDRIINALKSNGRIRLVAIPKNSPDNKIQLMNVLYLVNGVSVEDISQKAKKFKILTFSSNFEDVNKGFASITVILRNNTPKVIVNLNNSKQEGQNLSSQLLKLSEII